MAVGELGMHGQGRLWRFKNTVKKEKSSLGDMRHCPRKVFSLTFSKSPPQLDFSSIILPYSYFIRA